MSLPSHHSGGMKGCGFSFGGLLCNGRSRNNPSKSFRVGVKRGSEGIKAFGKSLRFGVTQAVFPEDLKVSERKVFDPQDKSLQFWNKLFVISCILAVSVDPLFFYLPVFNTSNCLGIDKGLAAVITTVRTVLDAFFLIRMGFQFRTAYIAPSSRVFGRGELVINPAQIAMRYLKRYFIIDLLSVIPAPQVLLLCQSFSDISTPNIVVIALIPISRLWSGSSYKNRKGRRS